METADTLRIKFDCKDDAALGALFGRTGGAVSVWRKKGLPASIEKRAAELMKGRGMVEAQPTTIAEQIGEGYAPEVKLMADYLQVKIEGKSREERLIIIEDIMADIRSKYK